MVKFCLVCKKQFITYSCLIKQGKGKYCSRECSSKTLFKKGLIPWNKGIKMPEITGDKHGRWRGFRLCGRNNNYREIRINGRYIREHRIVMEKHLGRKLINSEEVHHIDGNGLNNDISNLMIISNKHRHLQLEHKIGKYKNVWKKRKGLLR